MQLIERLRPGAWSYRVKVPLLIAAISAATALAVSVAIAVSARHWLREDLKDHAAAVAESLSRGLVVHMARDDVWEAFEAVRAVAVGDEGAPRCDVVVLDRQQRVFVSSQPTRLPIRAPATALDAPLQRAAAMVVRPGDISVDEARTDEGTFSIVATPLLSADKEVVGTLLMSWSHAVFAGRYRETLATLAIIAGTLVVVLLPLGWWLGHRVARPVARVTEALYRMGEDATVRATAYSGAARPAAQPHAVNEMDRLEHALSELQRQLDEKDVLQRQFVAADRLAAIGRMTAGVAHEINNPLAGMLAALSNLRKDPSLSTTTLALIERGLGQIRQTLSALLIETRSAHRELSPVDLDDLRILAAPQAERKGVQLAWHCAIDQELALPAAPVRQVVLNLLLNALQAASRHVAFDAGLDGERLRLSVVNDGREFPLTRQARPFEPELGGEGNGLGLWASHQLVISMGGTIVLAVESGLTRFNVELPLHPLPPTADATARHEATA